jgi:hypothetical protein
VLRFSTASRLFAAGAGVFTVIVAAITRFTAKIASISAVTAAIEILIFFCIFSSSELSCRWDTLGNPWKKVKKLFQIEIEAEFEAENGLGCALFFHVFISN